MSQVTPSKKHIQVWISALDPRHLTKNAQILTENQNTFQKTRTEAEQSLFRLLSATEESLTESVKMTAISDYNNIYMTLLDNFKNGIEHGEESMEGFKVMLDSSAKIISISIYWLENN